MHSAAFFNFTRNYFEYVFISTSSDVSSHQLRNWCFPVIFAVQIAYSLYHFFGNLASLLVASWPGPYLWFQMCYLTNYRNLNWNLFVPMVCV